jgi:hypothetical protein
MTITSKNNSFISVLCELWKRLWHRHQWERVASSPYEESWVSYSRLFEPIRRKKTIHLCLHRCSCGAEKAEFAQQGRSEKVCLAWAKEELRSVGLLKAETLQIAPGGSAIAAAELDSVTKEASKSMSRSSKGQK